MAVIVSADMPPETSEERAELDREDGARNARQEHLGTGGKRAAGGGKLNRSETVTVRLDPKLSYLCELAARAHRRTKSSFIEWAVAESLRATEIPGENVTIAERNMELWDVEEADRLVALAQNAPALLTHDEQRVWKLITTSGWFWRGHYDSNDLWKFETYTDRLITERVREKWELIKTVAESPALKPGHYEFANQRRLDPPLGGGFLDDDLSDDVPF